MQIQIFQGHRNELPPSEINIVIDVIRAFTVAHHAFIKGAKEILLVRTLEEAFNLKGEDEKYVLAGEIQGLPIEGFQLDNSPVNLLRRTLSGKTLVQKTTNGVEATLHSLNATSVFVTGFSNARTTALYILDLYLRKMDHLHINIIASHPSGDDDLACAEYIRSILTGANDVSVESVMKRIRQSHVAHKFFDPCNPHFNADDITVCMTEVDEGFVMKVNKDQKIPTIERVNR